MNYKLIRWIKELTQSFFHSHSPQQSLKKALQISDEKKERAVFVFDIDSTLFCMKYRTQAIIDQALQEEFMLKEFSKYSKKMSEVKVTETDWSIAEILSRYEIRDKKLLKKMESYWRRIFFSDRYLHLDKPYEGATDFLNKLTASHIYYLTARNSKSLRQGTIKSLKEWGFPLQKESQLIMKENSDESDTNYKSRHLAVLSKPFESACFFENEPVILHQVNRTLPYIHLFWMNSAHSRRAKAPPKALPLSMTYSL